MRKKTFRSKKKPTPTLFYEQEVILANYIINRVKTFLNADENYQIDRSRKQEKVYARYVCMYLIKENTNKLVLDKIGTFFNKDHSAVMHGCKKISNYLYYDKDIQNDISTLQSSIDKKKKKLLYDIYDEEDEGSIRINLNSFTSIKVDGMNKYLLAVNFADNEIDVLKRMFKETKIHNHQDTGIYFCEEKKNIKRNGKQ